MSEQVLQVFAKAPVAGFVKTRLIDDIGTQDACTLYLELLQQTLQLAGNHVARTQLYCAPNEQHDFFQGCVQRYSLELCTQVGDDLGDRMLDALEQGLKTHQKVVLIGSDCPVLTHSYLNEAFEALELVDVVLGPAEDGGFVLIGCRVTHLDMFKGVSWGGSSVLKNTLGALNNIGLEHQLLTTLWDVDRLEDLRRWQAMS